MCKEAPKIVYEMEHWGCPFSRFPTGLSPSALSAVADFRAPAFHDITGHSLLNTLYERAVYKMLKFIPNGLLPAFAWKTASAMA